MHVRGGRAAVKRIDIKMDRKFYRDGFIFIYVFPAFLLYLIGILLPNIAAVLMSFIRWDGFTFNFKWVGTANYAKMLGDPMILKAFLNNMYFAFFTMAFTIAIALFFAAVFCKSNLRETPVYKTIYFFPNIMSMVVISLLWSFMYNPQFGLINSLLKALGLESLTRVWLGDLSIVKAAIIVPQVWMSVGLYMLIYIAAIQNITNDLYEAATIDGASMIKQFFRITLPLIWDIIKVTMVYFMANALNAGFTIIKIMTNGGPNNETIVLSTYLYNTAFQNVNFGYGASIGTFILVIGLCFYLFIEKVLKSESYQY
jgi:N-acetylglucosamine transport system permease protein